MSSRNFQRGRGNGSLKANCILKQKKCSTIVEAQKNMQLDSKERNKSFLWGSGKAWEWDQWKLQKQRGIRDLPCRKIRFCYVWEGGPTWRWYQEEKPRGFGRVEEQMYWNVHRRAWSTKLNWIKVRLFGTQFSYLMSTLHIAVIIWNSNTIEIKTDCVSIVGQ